MKSSAFVAIDSILKYKILDLEQKIELNSKEKEYYLKKKNNHSKLHFLIGRKLIWQIIAENGYKNIQINFGKNYRPELINQTNTDFIDCSITHSKELVACVLADCKIGIDIEHIKERKSFKAIAKRYFSPAELIKIDDSPEKFYQTWTNNEAYIKFHGLMVQNITRNNEKNGVYHSFLIDKSYILSLYSQKPIEITWRLQDNFILEQLAAL